MKLTKDNTAIIAYALIYLAFGLAINGLGIISFIILLISSCLITLKLATNNINRNINIAVVLMGIGQLVIYYFNFQALLDINIDSFVITGIAILYSLLLNYYLLTETDSLSTSTYRIIAIMFLVFLMLVIGGHLILKLVLPFPNAGILRGFIGITSIISLNSLPSVFTAVSRAATRHLTSVQDYWK